MDAAATETLIEGAAKKSGLVWVVAVGTSAAGGREQPVWHVWQDGAVYVLTGGIEQPVPGGIDALGADGTGRAHVLARGKGPSGRVLTFETTVSKVSAGSDEWEAVVPALMAGRLNLPDGADAPKRWAVECTLWKLRPTGTIVETAADADPASHAAEPPPTPARSRVPRPLHLRGRPARNRGGR
jgi:hypothetical protein